MLKILQNERRGLSKVTGEDMATGDADMAEVCGVRKKENRNTAGIVINIQYSTINVQCSSQKGSFALNIEH
jgi:hypothetical protein